jgi:hypothetical protein
MQMSAVEFHVFKDEGGWSFKIIAYCATEDRNRFLLSEKAMPSPSAAWNAAEAEATRRGWLATSQ